MTDRALRLRHAFMMSASFPLAALAVAPVRAEQTVTVAGTTTAPAVNAQIQTKAATPDRDITITVTTDGVVTGPGNIFLSGTTKGQADGKIQVTNNGRIGVVSDAGAVTDQVGVVLIGAGQSVTDNTLALANDGLVTGGLFAQNFGGSVSVTNSKTLYGGFNPVTGQFSAISASGFGDVAVSNAAGGAIRSGGITATASTTSASKTADGVTTTTVSSGNVKVVSDGTVASGDDVSASPAPTRGNVAGSGNGDVSVAVNGIAGAVSAVSTPGFTSTSSNAPAAAGKTVTTSQTSTTYGGGAGTVTIGTAGDVTSAQAVGSGTSTVSVAGKVANNASAGFAARTDTTSKSTTTQDADGNVTGSTFDSSSLSRGPVATASVDQTGSVGGSLSATGVTSATATNAGKVTGSVTATTSGTRNSFSSVVVQNAKGVQLSNTTVSTSAPIGGVATASNASGASVGGTNAAGSTVIGSISATGAGGAVVTNAGSVNGGASATSSPALATTTTTASTRNDDGTATTSSTKAVNAAAGNTASVTNAKGGSIAGGVSANGNTGATIANAGTIGTTASPVSVSATGGLFVQTLNQRDQASTTATSTTGSTSQSSDRTTQQYSYSKGNASVTNDSGGLVSGSIAAQGSGDVTLANAGTVRGTTTGTSDGETEDSTYATLSRTDVVDATATTLKTTTTMTSTPYDYVVTSTGGSVTGTYSGVNGAKNFGIVDGSISQTANANSSATVSGTVFGNVASTAGSGSNSTYNSTATTTTVRDSDGAGSNASTSKQVYQSKQSAGTSTVAIGGTLENVGTGASVNLNGTTGATLSVAGTVGGAATVYAATQSYSSTDTTDYAQTVTKGAPATTTTTAYNRTSAYTSLQTAGATSVDVTGTVSGGVTTIGVASATASVGTAGKIGSTAAPASLYVGSGYNDNSGSTTVAYARDITTGVATGSNVTTSFFGPAAASGNASATVAGTVSGTTTVNANRGNATVALTGVSNAGVIAEARGTETTNTTSLGYSGKAAASAGTSDALLNAIPLASRSIVDGSKNVGGTASITIDSTQALKDASTLATNGTVYASGIGGASVALTAGTKVGGNVTASTRTNSAGGGYFDQTRTQVDSFTASGRQNGSTVTTVVTPVGGAATVTNAGTIAGTASAIGNTAATVTNSGRAAALVGQSISTGSTTKLVQNNLIDAAQRTDVTTTTFTPVGGTTTVTNAAGGVVTGGVVVNGGTGTLTNGGTIGGTSVLGTAVNSYTLVTTQTASATTSTLTPALFTQTYTANQNGTSGGIAVTGATITTTPPGATAAQTYKTSTINATVNLNDGSLTLGNITAQVDTNGDLGTKGARLTNTVVNLNGSGFLGLDTVAPAAGSGTVAQASPAATLTTDAKAVFGTSPLRAVQVTGVSAINKTGSGTFVIVGTPNVPAANVATTYALDVGALNVNAGELQLALPIGASTPPSTAEFAIRGNINNAATLVIGRRTPFNALSYAPIGNSLTGGSETISGVTVRLVGDYTQAATGTTLVGLTPSLIRVYPTAVSQGATSSEVLGVPTGGVSFGYFTTASALGIQSANSRINVTGNLNLAGTFAVEGSRDSLVTAGDGYVLFTYTGTATISSAAVSSTLTSPFVKFALTNDTNAKTVSIAATRTSYATGAGNTNAQAAAIALDTALTSVVTAIRTDATGGAGYASVTQLGYAQDIANVAAALDYRLGTAQVTELFDELSSAEFYASLGAVNQNAAFGTAVSQLTANRDPDATGARLWLSPAGSFARYSGGGAYGASAIRANSYGGAGGLEIGYAPGGAFGVGGGYGEHDVRARGTMERARGNTWTLGAYLSQRFMSAAPDTGAYVNASLAYGFSRFNTSRTLTLLARTPTARFRGNQFDGSLELGYDFAAGGAVLTPFAKAMLRRYQLDGFTEANGGGLGLNVGEQKKSVFSPVVGAKVSGLLGAGLRPYLKGSYTFQGDIDASRTVSYLGGGSAFTLRGVDPDGFGTIEAGVDGSLGQVGLFLQGGYSFGGSNKVANVRAGVSFGF